TLQKINEPKGYFFNCDGQLTLTLLAGLLTNKERYDYMLCPCRLTQDDREADRDIICPCDYREADVHEFGSCYCGLYVSAGWNDGTISHVFVPERRPAEKC
ncbi:MAG: ferredoxin-thioredoxin reductase catalytic domain-containing protein, partial [Desulfoprunum sp.]|nr:ferredoxin-thioredoxin reductase catalytic domain-containing protein [Desulfoprunum sp.]